jgi:TDG/mug DNA glycosylase family protein
MARRIGRGRPALRLAALVCAKRAELVPKTKRRSATDYVRPTRSQLTAAKGKGTPDVLTACAKLWFVGVNPGLYSAAIGHHFGRPGNRFWPVLERAGFTPGRWSPFDDERLPELGLGITNLVPRATARAEELTQTELRRGAKRLATKVAALEPRVVAVLGVTAFRLAFACPEAKLGKQTEPIAGATLWVLPNPSGLNAHHQLDSLTRLFSVLREYAFARG